MLFQGGRAKQLTWNEAAAAAEGADMGATAFGNRVWEASTHRGRESRPKKAG